MEAKAVKVTRKGQITLPAGLRRELGIEEGDLVYVRKGERGIEILTPQDWVARTAGMFRDDDRTSPIEWDRDQIWTEIARERFERSPEDAPGKAVQPGAEATGKPDDHD